MSALASNRRVLPILLVAGGLAWFGARAWHFSAWMDDDAFISLRYARNLIDGHGLVFNPGETVEGYSNLLWVLAVATAGWAGADLPRAAQVLGVSAAVALVLTLSTAGPGLLPTSSRGRSAPHPALGALAPLVLATNDGFAAWSVGGLENCLGALLVTWLLLAWFRALDDGPEAPRHGLVAGLAGALAALAHPSYALFGLAVGGQAALRALAGRCRFATLLALAAPPLALGLPYLAWKWYFYGALLPNTFHAKTGGGVTTVARGLRYGAEAWGAYWPLALGCAALGLGWLLRRPRDPWAAALCASALLYLAYGVLIGGEAFPAFRLGIVLIPIGALALQDALVRVGLCVRGLATRPLPALCLVAAGTACAALPVYVHPRVRALDRAIAEDDLGLFRSAAAELARRLPPDTLLAYSGAGVMAYDTGFPLLDTLGLCDACIARSTPVGREQAMIGHERGDGAYVLARRPHVVMFSGRPVSSHDPMFPADRELAELPGFADLYRPVVMTFAFAPHGRGAAQAVEVPLYLREDVPWP